MLSMDLPAALTAERSRDLAREAQASRLVALARCCRPSAWRGATRRLSETVTGAVHRLTSQQRQPSQPTACCVTT